MDDLISRAAAVRALASSNGDYLDALDRFEKIPAVDVVPVVRCKDCKYWDGRGKCRINNGYHSWVKDDWFCADGERRDSE